MHRRTWIVVGSLAGLVGCPGLVLLAALSVPGLAGPILRGQGVPALLISGAAGLVLGGFLAWRATLGSPRRVAMLGAVSGAVLGAVLVGSFFLAVEVTGPDWPHGLAASVTGAIAGAALGGIAGGAAGFSSGRAATGTSGLTAAQAATSRREAR